MYYIYLYLQSSFRYIQDTLAGKYNRKYKNSLITRVLQEN